MSANRARRTTAKAVNYAKEQEFSDDDVFEDDPNDEPPKRKRNNASAAEQEEYYKSEKPVYTEKGYDPTLPPIRERFSFLPETEDDGSPKIDLIVGRRPVGEKEDAPSEKDSPEPKPRKTRRNESPKNEDQQQVVEYEYLVKYKGRSYMHLEWKSGADLESMNKSAKGIYRRYLKKVAAGLDEELENPEFDPSYVVAERILDEADQEITVELTDKELLKWETEREKEMEAEKDSDGAEEKAEQKTPSKDDEEPKPAEKEEEVDGT